MTIFGVGQGTGIRERGISVAARLREPILVLVCLRPVEGRGLPGLRSETPGARFNSYLALGISLLKELYGWRHVRIYQIDVFNLMLSVAASPGSYSLTNVTTPAQFLPVDPDTYLFWDDLHPTTKGHNIVAEAAAGVLSQ